MTGAVGKFFAETKRRRVFRTAGFYAVAAAGIWGAAEVAVDALGLPSQALTFVVVTTIVGFPFALVLSWFFQVEAEGGAAAQGRGITKSRAVALGLTVAIVAFVGLATSMAMRGADGSPTADLPAFERTQITFLGNALDPAISPDGRYVAFHASFSVPTSEDLFTDSLMVVVPGEAEPRALAAMPPNRLGGGGGLPRIRWSPDGSELWYSVYDSTLYSPWRAVPLEGGASREVFEHFESFALAPDGGRVAYPVYGETWPGVRIQDLKTGEETDVNLDGSDYRVPLLVDWSPVGDRIALSVFDPEMGRSSIWSLPVDGGSESYRLASSAETVIMNFQWSRDGEGIFYDRGGRLWRVDVDPATGEPIEEDGAFTGHDLTGAFSLSADGRRLVLEQRQGGRNIWAFPLENDSLRADGLRLTRGAFFRDFARFSPDGSRVAYSTFEDEARSRSRGISVISAQGGQELRITESPSWSLAWSPDGTELAFIGEYEDSHRVFVVGADQGTQRMVGRSPASPDLGLSWCENGEVLYTTGDQSNIVVLDLEGGTERLLRQDSVMQFMAVPVCSPGSSEVAVFAVGEGQEIGMYAVDLQTGKERLVLPHSMATPHTWPSGGWIYTQNGKVPEEGGEVVAFELDAAVLSLGGLGAFQGVATGTFQALLLVPEPTSSDLYLIEYGNEGG